MNSHLICLHCSQISCDIATHKQWCMNCQTVDHPFGNCPKNFCLFCKSKGHLQPRCKYMVQAARMKLVKNGIDVQTGFRASPARILNMTVRELKAIYKISKVSVYDLNDIPHQFETYNWEEPIKKISKNKVFRYIFRDEQKLKTVKVLGKSLKTNKSRTHWSDKIVIQQQVFGIASSLFYSLPLEKCSCEKIEQNCNFFSRKFNRINSLSTKAVVARLNKECEVHKTFYAIKCNKFFSGMVSGCFTSKDIRESNPKQSLAEQTRIFNAQSCAYSHKNLLDNSVNQTTYVGLYGDYKECVLTRPQVKLHAYKSASHIGHPQIIGQIIQNTIKIKQPVQFMVNYTSWLSQKQNFRFDNSKDMYSGYHTIVVEGIQCSILKTKTKGHYLILIKTPYFHQSMKDNLVMTSQIPKILTMKYNMEHRTSLGKFCWSQKFLSQKYKEFLAKSIDRLQRGISVGLLRHTQYFLINKSVTIYQCRLMGLVGNPQSYTDFESQWQNGESNYHHQSYPLIGAKNTNNNKQSNTQNNLTPDPTAIFASIERDNLINKKRQQLHFLQSAIDAASDQINKKSQKIILPGTTPSVIISTQADDAQLLLQRDALLKTQTQKLAQLQRIQNQATYSVSHITVAAEDRVKIPSLNQQQIRAKNAQIRKNRNDDNSTYWSKLMTGQDAVRLIGGNIPLTEAKMDGVVMDLQTFKNCMDDQPYGVQFNSHGKINLTCLALKQKNEASKKIKQSQIILDPKTYGEYIQSMCDKKLSDYANKAIMKAQDLQTGDYIVFDKGQIAVFQQVSKMPYKNMDPNGTFKPYPVPVCVRQVYDVALPVSAAELRRHTQVEYQAYANKIIPRITGTTVIQGETGSGKSTYLMVVLRKMIKQVIYITLPNIVLARDVYKSLTAASLALKSGLTIGYKIDSKVQEGDIVVQTPGYLQSGVLNVFDQFQFVTQFNRDFFCNRKNYAKLILMSATPYGTLLGCLRKYGMPYNLIQMQSTRVSKSFLLHTKGFRSDCNTIPNRTIVFGNDRATQITKNVTANLKRLTITIDNNRPTAQFVHPNYVFGYNPGYDLYFGSVQFTRKFFTTTQYRNMFYLGQKLPADIQSVIQALGRLMRYVDCIRVLMVGPIASYSLLRFQTPRPERYQNQQFKFVYQSFLSKSSPNQLYSEVSHLGLAGAMYPINAGFVKIAGQQAKVQGAPTTAKGVFGLTWINGMFLGAYYSNQVGTFEAKEKPIPNPFLDRGTGKYVYNIKHTPGVKPVFRIQDGGNETLQIMQSLSKSFNVESYLNFKQRNPHVEGYDSIAPLLISLASKFGSTHIYANARIVTETTKILQIMQNTTITVGTNTNGAKVAFVGFGESILSVLSITPMFIVSSHRLIQGYDLNFYIIVKGVVYNVFTHTSSIIKLPQVKTFILDKIWNYSLDTDFVHWTEPGRLTITTQSQLIHLNQIDKDLNRISNSNVTAQQIFDWCKNGRYGQGMLECLKGKLFYTEDNYIEMIAAINERKLQHNMRGLNYTMNQFLQGDFPVCTGDFKCLRSCFHSLQMISQRFVTSYARIDQCNHEFFQGLPGSDIIKNGQFYECHQEALTHHLQRIIKQIQSLRYQTVYISHQQNMIYISDHVTLGKTWVELNRKNYLQIYSLTLTYKQEQLPINATIFQVNAKKQFIPLRFFNQKISFQRDFPIGFYPIVYVKLSTGNYNKIYFKPVRGHFCSCMSYTHVDYTLYNLGMNSCYQCITEHEVSHLYKKGTSSLWDLILDMWKLLKGGVQNQQSMVSKWGKKIKCFLERNQPFQVVRKLIHMSGVQNTKLHQQFNALMNSRGLKPALLKQLYALLTFAATIISGTATIYRALTKRTTYQQILTQNYVTCSPQFVYKISHPTYPIENNAMIQGQVITCNAEIIPIPNSKNSSSLLIDGKVNQAQGRLKDISDSQAPVEHFAGHPVCQNARNFTSAAVAKNLGNKSFIQLGGRKYPYSTSPILFISQQYDNTFRCPNNHQSLGIYGNYSHKSYQHFMNAAQAWIQQKQPLYVHSRDSIHDPASLQFVMKLMCDPRSTVKMFYWQSHFPLTQTQCNYTNNDLNYSTNKSQIQGWMQLCSHPSSQYEFYQIVPTYVQVHRICSARGLVVQYTPIRVLNNLTYGYFTISKSGQSQYTMRNQVSNNLGQFNFDSTGKIGRNLNAIDKHLYTKGTTVQKTVMLDGGLGLSQTAQIQSQKIQIVDRNIDWYLMQRYKDYLNPNRTQNQKFRDRQTVTSYLWSKLQERLRSVDTLKHFFNKPVYGQGEDVSQTCWRKQFYVTGTQNNSNQLLDHIRMNVILNPNPALPHHLAFRGQRGSVKIMANFQPGLVAGRGNKLEQSIDAMIQNNQFQFQPYKVHQFVLPTSHFVKTPLSQSPTVFHPSQQAFNRMLAKGFNSTVMQTMTINLDGRKLKLPNIFSYRMFASYCTCTNTKCQMFSIQDQIGHTTGAMGSMCPCPVSQIIAILDRQSGTQVSPDPNIMVPFKQNTYWFIDGIMNKMSDSKFTVHLDDQIKQQYLQHVGLSSPYNQQLYRRTWNLPTKKNERANMFIKSQQNHIVYSDPARPQLSTKDSIKPRIINCNSGAIRGRVGAYSYKTLSFLKRDFSEFFLSMTKQKFLKTLSDFQQFPFTYQSDFSNYDSTNGAFHRTCVDVTFTQQMYKRGIARQYNMNGLLYYNKNGKKQISSDRYFASSVQSKFYTNIRGNTGGRSILKISGKLFGTTYSGHPSATTLFGTTRNFFYHLNAIYQCRQLFSFYNQIQSLPKIQIRISRNQTITRPPFLKFLNIVRKYIKMMFAGDDTGIACRYKQDVQAIQRSMRLFCHTKQQKVVHGLGLILKKPKKDYKRINILSRNIAVYKNKPIVLRMIDRLLLTGSSRTKNLTQDQAHYLSAMSLYSTSLDPISQKLIKIRLSMISHSVDTKSVHEQFIKNRAHKLGTGQKYTIEQSAHCYNMTVQNYIKLLDSIKLSPDKKFIIVNFQLLKIKPQFKKQSYVYGFNSCFYQRLTVQKQKNQYGQLFHGNNFKQIKPTTKQTLRKCISNLFNSTKVSYSSLEIDVNTQMKIIANINGVNRSLQSGYTEGALCDQNHVEEQQQQQPPL